MFKGNGLGHTFGVQPPKHVHSFKGKIEKKNWRRLRCAMIIAKDTSGTEEVC